VFLNHARKRLQGLTDALAADGLKTDVRSLDVRFVSS